MNTLPLLRCTLAAAALMLGACQMTTFDKAPLAAGPCDPQLAGRWLSQDEDPAKNGEVALEVDASCQLVVEATQNDGVRRSAPTPLHLGQSGLYRYAWVDAAWTLAQFEPGHAATPGDVYVLRYAVADDRLTLWTPQDKAVAHAIIDGQLEGEVVSKNRDLFYRLTGNEAPAVLDHEGLFNADPVQFARAAEPAR